MPPAGACPGGGAASGASAGPSYGGRYIDTVVPCCGARVDGHEAAAMARDTLHEGQAEPGPLADLLGGEERLEEMRLHVRGHADAVVA